MKIRVVGIEIIGGIVYVECRYGGKKSPLIIAVGPNVFAVAPTFYMLEIYMIRDIVLRGILCKRMTSADIYYELILSGFGG